MVESVGIDVRWRQRFANFSRALARLDSAITGGRLAEYSELELEGIIQRFEYTFELAWKTLKDYLEYSGVEITQATPRKVIKECFAVGIFDEADIDAEIFLEMISARNDLSHTYDISRFELALDRISSLYLAELLKEENFLRKIAAADA